MSNTRQPGYYWVKQIERGNLQEGHIKGGWIIAKFLGYHNGQEYWEHVSIGPNEQLNYSAINEARIPTPDEALYDEIIAHATAGETYTIESRCIMPNNISDYLDHKCDTLGITDADVLELYNTCARKRKERSAADGISYIALSHPLSTYKIYLIAIKEGSLSRKTVEDLFS